MIKYRQKIFSEHDAMNYFYNSLMNSGGDRNRWKVIDSSALVPILKGNNIVIEKFTIIDSWLNKDRYRMYLRIGAKAKMPDSVRLPKGQGYDQDLGKISIKLSNDKGFNSGNGRGNGNGNNGGGEGILSTSWNPQIGIKYRVDGEVLGKTIKYDKTARLLILEFQSIWDAIKSLNILPFGIGYKIYLLESR